MNTAAAKTDSEVAERMKNVDYRAAYLERSLRCAISTMQGARSAMTGKRHSFARDILDRDIADAEKTLRLCDEATK